ncbi:MAG: MarC family NAAT transporter [Bacteroidetes bacterium]|nr:MarC family NAAT transporter [Bacteroidota bacterium]
MTAAYLLKYFLTTFTGLFSIVNPLSAMPVFLALTINHTPAYRNLMAKKAAIYMTLILVFFVIAGSFILSFFGISINSIRIAGGLIVLQSGYSLLTADENAKLSKKSRKDAMDMKDISLTPLALPLLSGPGSIAATISLTSTARSVEYGLIVLCILVIGLLSFLSLRLSQKLLLVFSKSGLEAITRLMGFISMTVGVQFIINGILPIIAKLHTH